MNSKASTIQKKTLSKKTWKLGSSKPQETLYLNILMEDLYTESYSYPKLDYMLLKGMDFRNTFTIHNILPSIDYFGWGYYAYQYLESYL